LIWRKLPVRRKCDWEIYSPEEKNLVGTVHVVDDDASFRVAVKRRVEKAGHQVLVYSTAQEFLDQGHAENGPSCILLDVRMTGLGGPELQNRLNELGSTVPVIFVSGYAEISTTVRVLEAGADDFLTKPLKSSDLLIAIDKALARHSSLRELNGALDVLRARLATLTPRQRQVIALVVRGNINKQIAHQLGTAERTIKAHRQRVMEKMRVQSVAELVSIAERLGLLRE
jgi:FixJ family two-component response regulator